MTNLNPGPNTALLFNTLKMSLKLLCKIHEIMKRNQLAQNGATQVNAQLELPAKNRFSAILNSCIVSYHKQFPTMVNKTGINVLIYGLTINGKLSIIRCNK